MPPLRPLSTPSSLLGCCPLLLTTTTATQTTTSQKQQALTFAHKEPICDTVRCGETAKFQLRDGGSCASTLANTEWRVKENNGRYSFKCTPATAQTSPCAACGANSAGNDGCLWTWTAPVSENAALAVPTPSGNKCRCTDYEPAPIKEWLCDSANQLSSCANPLSYAQCAGKYSGNRPCFLRQNWNKLLEAQGLGPSVDGIVIGGGDRAIKLNLNALECACQQWGLSTKVATIKTLPPAPTPPTCPTINDVDDPAPNCTQPTWKWDAAQLKFLASSPDLYNQATCPVTGSVCNNGPCAGACCGNLGVGACPTSSCHANQLGDQELNCP